MDQWPRVKAVFQSALERAPEERSAFVRDACGDDGDLRADVESLLVAHEAAGHFATSGSRVGDPFPPELIGREIGAYRIISLLGAGGMGEVYRARDTKLHRDVAIKVLPPAFTVDPDRLARLKREARVLATLNHPHIGAIYGLEEAAGSPALVLELIEGETLAERLARTGRLGVETALPMARQIAEALEAAHEKGITHRDLKPANIKIAPDGSVKVLDFGLAKATISPTSEVAATATGVLMGTAAYMSPEQARGQAVDKRSDIWSFGSVLYEMLTGRPAFAAETVSDTIASVMRGEPDWSALPKDLSSTFQVYLRRCLQKNPRDRVHDIADLRLALEGAFDVVVPSTRSHVNRRNAIAIAAVTLAALGSTIAWRLSGPSTGQTAAVRPIARVSIPTRPLAALNRPPASAFALSPDGTLLAYVAGDGRRGGQLYVRALDALEARPLGGVDNASAPFFSPDGKWIAFFSGGQLKKVAVSGGTPVPLTATATASQAFGGSWRVDDSIFFTGPGIWRVSGEGGKAELAIKTDFVASWPEALPGGNTVLVTNADDPNQIWSCSLESRECRLLIDGGGHARYLSSRHLIYTSQGSLMAAPFDAERAELLGPAVPVVQTGIVDLPGAPLGQFAVSSTGTLAYLPGPILTNSQRTLLWVDRQGREEPLDVEPRAYECPRISPDGTRAAFEVFRDGNRDVGILDFASKKFTHLTFHPADDRRPVWTPDGKRVVFSSTRDGGGRTNLFSHRADGAGQTERLTTQTNEGPSAWSFTPDGQTLLYTQFNPATGWDVHVLSMERPYHSRPLLQQNSIQGHPALSSDGHWIAYRSDEAGRMQIYVRPFPNVDDGGWRVSTNGGARPRWARGGRELFYQLGDSTMVVPIDTDPTFSHGEAKLLFSGDYSQARGGVPNFDVSPDGQRFLMIRDVTPIEPSARDEVIVVLNWHEELKRLVPTK